MLLGLCTAVLAVKPGRTDGPEGSEYGAGGYWHHRESGTFFTEGLFGAAAVDAEHAATRTDLISGIDAGYMVEDWLAFLVGYAHIADQSIDLFSLGMRSQYDMDPFNYYFSLGAELYSPDRGDDQFGIIPGVGAEMILTDRARVGLAYQHDFVLADDTINVDRFTVRVQIRF